MRVAMYYANDDVRVEEVPIPGIGEGEILMRIEASGICGSDLMEWYRRDKVPLVLGHEVAGTVEKVGLGVERYKVGDRIVVSHHVPCNSCDYCQRGDHTVCETLQKGTYFDPGGFAEFVRVPTINVEKGVYHIPDGVAFAEATFAEPLACVLRGQEKIGLGKGHTVFVIGSGISGLLHIALAKARGADHIVAADISRFRLSAARKFGADEAIAADENLAANLIAANNGKKADRVILCTGALSAVTATLESVEHGGTVLFFAPTNEGEELPFSINKVFWKTEVTLTTTYAGAPPDHVKALELIRDNAIPVTEMITHTLPLADIQKGFELVAKGDESIKVIIQPQL
jgi:L-iditol 2-dehydrogenase